MQSYLLLLVGPTRSECLVKANFEYVQCIQFRYLPADNSKICRHLVASPEPFTLNSQQFGGAFFSVSEQ